MRTHVIARKTHKWLGLFIGLQVVIWSLSGLYMTVVHIDTIHGDHLIRSLPQKNIAAADLVDPLTVAAANQGQSVRLAWVRNQPAGAVRLTRTTLRLDAARSLSRAPSS
jgi:uncharacterized iron-regulated membrane protein